MPISSSSIPAASLDSAKQEFLSAIGEAMAENGKVIITAVLAPSPRHRAGLIRVLITDRSNTRVC